MLRSIVACEGLKATQFLTAYSTSAVDPDDVAKIWTLMPELSTRKSSLELNLHSGVGLMMNSPRPWYGTKSFVDGIVAGSSVAPCAFVACIC